MKSIDKWEESKLTGNHAENIVEFLVNSVPDWKCVRFGIENHIDDLKKLVKGNINPITRKIKSMPDFVVFNSKTGETFFIEAKFRGFVDQRGFEKLEFKLDFLEEYQEYWEGTKLIIIHGYAPYFFVIDLKDVKSNMCRKEGMNYYWNFVDIRKGIKELFPELPEETITKAIGMIPKK